ncbi:MAG: DUF4832 domain-containing protein [Dysgonamonadaceae bacterium]|jgi:hypothetical protein|nr:DUF4832 domain-containing protein [Dysgonamonadaceae bacterium]
MKKIELILLFLVSFFGLSCGSHHSTENIVPKKETIEYKSIDDKFPNPERGFYKYSDCNLGTGTGILDENTLKAYRGNNISLLFRYFYLKNFRDKPISDKALEDFDKDMAIIRKAGMKCVLRFAYSSAINEPDAPLNTILQHLDQLKPHLEKNADVIAVMQAGFIGSWGEWYYTTNGLNTSGNRYMTLNKILETLPPNRMVQVRTPAYKKEFVQRTTPLKEEEAFSTQNIARIAHHNDCFLASTNDYGTYQDIEADKDYLNKDCLYVPIGGETCPPDGVAPADGLKAYNEMRRLRFSFLNEDYYRNVNNLWIENGYMDKIIRELGYRFHLVSGEYTTEVSPLGAFSARIVLKNAGFASLYNKRPVELILKNTASNELYKVKLEIEPRLWKPNTENIIDATIGIPAEMTKGEYALYLNLPDDAETLQTNPDYSVRFANENVWEAKTGYNNLLLTVTVKDNSSTPTFSGNLFFLKK